MAKLTPQDIRELINPSQWFGVTFIKRTTGEERKMTCKLGVMKHLKGGSKAYDADAKGLLTVWDRNAVGKHGPNDTGYRSINISGLTELRANGMVYVIQDQEIIRSYAKSE